MSFHLNLNTETVDHCHPSQPLCVVPSVTVGEALRQMKEHNRGTVLVCQDQAVVGIFTERDALKMMAEGTASICPSSSS